MTKHIHAELMKQYAEDAMETDEPWLLWEFMDNSGKWHGCSSHPSWSKKCIFRHKPSKSEVIKIGEYEFPKPVSKEPNEYDDYWYIDMDTDDGFCVYKIHWDNSYEDNCRLRCGFIHEFKEDAQKHADVLNKIHQIK